MTNFESMDKDQLALTLASSNDCCNYCSYGLKDECNDDETCAESIRKWFDEESNL